jgi:hypothetical protein
MSAANKAKGTLFERQVAEYLRVHAPFPSVERAPRWGSVDKGDLVNTDPFCFELKATKGIDLAGFMNEAVVEAQNAGREFPVVVIKRRQKPIAESYVVMRLEDWCDLVFDVFAHNQLNKESA